MYIRQRFIVGLESGFESRFSKTQTWSLKDSDMAMWTQGLALRLHGLKTFKKWKKKKKTLKNQNVELLQI